MNDEVQYCNLTGWRKLLVGTVGTLGKRAGDQYQQANRELYNNYVRSYQPDGKICFLAGNPHSKGKGVGSILLQEFERREPGKEVFLYTDSNCTYLFYEHRGFKRVGSKKITVDNEIDLDCFLYRKHI